MMRREVVAVAYLVRAADRATKTAADSPAMPAGLKAPMVRLAEAVLAVVVTWPEVAECVRTLGTLADVPDSATWTCSDGSP